MTIKKTKDTWPEPSPDPPISDLKLVSMKLEHLDAVLEIENSSFPIPWRREAFEYDLVQNALGHYWSLFQKHELIGYAGFWLVDRIAHLTTICIRENFRGKGLGRWLLLTVMKLGAEMGAERFTLEVRESNIPAISMYESVGYKIVGRREKYYKEINEDALIMWTGEPPYEA